VGVDLEIDAAPVVDACRERGLLVNAVRPKTLRFAPPLVVTPAQVDTAIEILDAALGAVAPAPGSAKEREIA
jgi:4-aminobutyrate aminotransferase-like enzyme